MAQREYTITELSRSRKASLSLKMARRPTRLTRRRRRCPRRPRRPRRSFQPSMWDYKSKTKILLEFVIGIHRNFNHRAGTTDFDKYFRDNCVQLIDYLNRQLSAVTVSIKKNRSFNPEVHEEPENILYIPPMNGWERVYRGESYLSTSNCRKIFDNSDTFSECMEYIKYSLYEIADNNEDSYIGQES